MEFYSIDSVDIIFCACKNNNIRAIENYVKNNGYINIINFNKLSMLMYICDGIFDSETFDTIKYLVDIVKININYINTNNNQNIFFYLIKEHNLDRSTINMCDIFKYLIEKGGDINVINNNGESILIYLIKKNIITDDYFADRDNVLNIVKLLIEYKININIRDNQGLQAIHYAILNNKKKISDLLFENGANICDVESNAKSASKLNN